MTLFQIIPQTVASSNHEGIGKDKESKKNKDNESSKDDINSRYDICYARFN